MIKYKNAIEVTPELIKCMEKKDWDDYEWIANGFLDGKLMVYLNPGGVDFIEILKNKISYSQIIKPGNFLVENDKGDFIGVKNFDSFRNNFYKEEKINVKEKGFATKALKKFKEKNKETTKHVVKEKMPKETTKHVVKEKMPKETTKHVVKEEMPKIPNRIPETLDIIRNTEKETRNRIYNLASYIIEKNIAPPSVDTIGKAVACVQTALSLGCKKHRGCVSI